MKSLEHFNELMQDPNYAKWYNALPELMKPIVQQYPWEKYVIGEGSPYGIATTGTTVYLQTYIEKPEGGDPEAKVIVFAKDFNDAAKEHIKYLCDTYHKDYNEMVNKDVLVQIELQYLDPIE